MINLEKLKVLIELLETKERYFYTLGKIDQMLSMCELEERVQFIKAYLGETDASIYQTASLSLIRS